MKYFSELTGEIFDTVDELKTAEEEINRINAEKERASEEIDAAYKKAVQAWEDYLEVSKKYKQIAYVPNSLFETVIKNFFDQFAVVVELADTRDLKSLGFAVVWVRIPPAPPQIKGVLKVHMVIIFENE